MKERTKNILILLASIAFATVATLLIITIMDMGSMQGNINKQNNVNPNLFLISLFFGLNISLRFLNI